MNLEEEQVKYVKIWNDRNQNPDYTVSIINNTGTTVKFRGDTIGMLIDFNLSTVDEIKKYIENVIETHKIDSMGK